MSKVIDLNNLFPEAADGTRGPLPKQKLFLDAIQDKKGPPYCMYSGGMGSGKTLIGCITIITLAVQFPGDYLVCRLFNPELKLTTYKTFLDICPKELILEHRVADQIVRLRSAGGKTANVIFRGLEDPEKHKSLNLNAAYIDEASQVSEEAFTLLQSRLRGAHVRKILCTTNPNGHSWLYRYWVKKDWGSERVKSCFLHISAPSTENVHLPEGYVQNLLDTWSKERRDREIMGSWDAFAGQVYTEYSRNVHVVKPFAIPPDWTRFVGADHGYRNPACFLWGAMDYDGNIWVYREFYQAEWTIEEIVRGRGPDEPGVVTLNNKDTIEGVWIDPSTRANRGKESDWTTYLEHLPREWSLMLANNEVALGIDQVKQRLKLDPRTQKPRLYIFDNCVNLIEQMAQYKYEELQPGQEGKRNTPETPVKKDDHAADALRYLVMSRPEQPRVMDLKEKQRQANTLSGSIQRELHELRQGGSPKDPFGEVYGRDPADWDSY